MIFPCIHLSLFVFPRRSPQIAEIGCHGVHLRSGHAVRHRRHDRGRIGLSGILAAFLAPVDQLVDRVIRQLPGKTGNFPGAFRVRPMAGRAGCDIGIGNAVLENSFTGSDQALRSAAERSRIERAEFLGKRRNHCRAQRMRDIEHDVVGAPVFDKCLQLVFQIFRLLPGKARHRIVSAITLSGRSVAIQAIGDLAGNSTTRLGGMGVPDHGGGRER